MNSDFLDKFKGKTNKVPKEGVVNLIEPTHKKQLKLIPPKLKDTKHPSSQKQTKTKTKKHKNSPSAKQNKHQNHVSHSANQPKRLKQKSVSKSREILSIKQNKKPLDVNINVKKQPLKLPKIMEEIPLHNAQSVRQTPKQPIKHHIKQTHQKTWAPEKATEKLKRSMLTEIKETKPERSQAFSHSLESMLNDEALIQLKKLNDLELIVQEISFKRRQQMQQEELQNSRHYRKRLTVHY